MKNKKYTIKTTCPQCGCSAVSHLSYEEIREKFGDVPNVEMECHECMLKYETPVKETCPEWDKDCKMKEVIREQKKFKRNGRKDHPDWLGDAQLR